MNLSDLQTAVSAALAADAVLSAAKVAALAQNKKDILGEVQERVAKLGICAIAITPKAKADGSATCGPLASLTVVVRVIENPPVNRSRSGYITALDAAEHIAASLHMRGLYPATAPLAFSSLDEAPVDGAIAYDVEFTAQIQLVTKE